MTMEIWPLMVNGITRGMARIGPSVWKVPAVFRRKRNRSWSSLMTTLSDVFKRSLIYGIRPLTFELQATTKFIHDGWDLVDEFDDANSLIHNYARSNGQLLFIAEANETYIAVSDVIEVLSGEFAALKFAHFMRMTADA